MRYDVITADDARRENEAGGAPPPVSKDDAFDKLFKYIPSVTVGRTWRSKASCWRPDPLATKPLDPD